MPKKPEELAHHLVTGYLNFDDNIPHQLPITHELSGETILIKNPGRIVINNDFHSLNLLQSNQVICAFFEHNYPILKSDEIITVLPDYYLVTLKYYLVSHPHSNDLKVKLFSEFLEQCLKNK